MTQSLSYFTCTLGEAVAWNEDHPRPWRTIIELLEYRTTTCPDLPAVGFANFSASYDDGFMSKSTTVLTHDCDRI
jgi:hypothetical protein